MNMVNGALLASKFVKGDTDQRLLSWLLNYHTNKNISNRRFLYITNKVQVLEPIGNAMYKVQTSKGNLTRNVTQMLPISAHTNVDITPEIINENATITTTNANSDVNDTIQPKAMVLRPLIEIFGKDR
ncbi:hypothetical protein FQR65_LT14077 [Abscondita terminalis]|nr:hypothetical protein FQR65_LT14077 [Abscondita terminalis]